MEVVLNAPATVTLIFFQTLEVVVFLLSRGGDPAGSIPVIPASGRRKTAHGEQRRPGHLPLTLFLHGLYAKAP